jgi:phosphoglycolate phosphatase-like HAD superfamily hydrolase
LRLLALDFDGVISDSAPEAFVVALRTWCALHPDSALREPAAPLLDEARAPSPAEVAACALYPPFLELMPLGNRAEDYAVELRALETGAPICDQAAYDAFKAELDVAALREFHRNFYRVRAAFCDRDAAAWQRLMAVYPGVPELLRRRADRCVLAIATSKDRRSVRRLLIAYGMDDLFPESRVLDKEAGVSKRAHLEQLGASFELEPGQMTFVDDKVNHLDDVAGLGVVCALAGWGYNGVREALLAQERGHQVLRLESLDRQLFGA